MEEKQIIDGQNHNQSQNAAASEASLSQQGVEEATEKTSAEEALEKLAHDVPRLLAEVQELRQDFDTKIKYDESKERLIDTLHKELQDYREGLHFKILRPVFIDLISIYDDMAKVLEGAASIERKQEVQILRSFQETVEEILHGNGVEAFEVEGDIFQPGRQRIQKAIETPEPELDRHVARRVRKGFAYENRILRLEIVEVYKYVKEQEAAL